MIRFKTTAVLLEEIQKDLRRPHPFAHERVGFLGAGFTLSNASCTILAHSYRSVPDVDYLQDPSVGAMLGPDAMFNAVAWAYETKLALFHIHEHGGTGIPKFSGVDLREAKKFVPDFFKFRPECPHGTIVLSNTAAFGHVWLDKAAEPTVISEFAVIGPRIERWSLSHA